MPVPHIAKAVGLIAVCGILGVYAAEFAVGRLLLAGSGDFPPDMFVADAARGIALAPGFDRIVTRVTSFRVSVNKEGYRDREWSTTREPRVLLAGSSATFGFGLESENGVAGTLGAALGDDASILNAGVYSYGPPQILATIERECPRWHPQAIVYMHEYKLTRGDFLSNRSLPDGKAAAADQPRRFPLGLPALRAYLSDHGLHPRQILERFHGLGGLSPSYLEAHYAITKRSAEYCADCAARAVDYIRRMRTAAESCGAKFIVAVLPGPAEAYYGMREPATEEVLSELHATAPDFSIVDLRDGIPLGSRFNIPALDYPNVRGVAWIAGHLVEPLRRALDVRPASSMLKG